jgi:colanic acid biosynthesis glycosyl transferase WcaI
VLEAARRLADHPGNRTFCFVGGGSEFATVAVSRPRTAGRTSAAFPTSRSPSFPASLSAADLHVVVMGDPLVGIVHTCKIYNIMCIGIASPVHRSRRKSHVMDIAAGNGIPLTSANHGDVGLGRPPHPIEHKPKS